MEIQFPEHKVHRFCQNNGLRKGVILSYSKHTGQDCFEPGSEFPFFTEYYKTGNTDRLDLRDIEIKLL